MPWKKYGCCYNSINRYLLPGTKQPTFFDRTAGLNSIRDVSLAAVMAAALTGIDGMSFVYSLLSVLWLSSLRDFRSYGSRHGLAPRLGYSFLFYIVSAPNILYYEMSLSILPLPTANHRAYVSKFA